LHLKPIMQPHRPIKAHRDRRSVAAALATSVVIGSCAVGPNFTPPQVTVGDKWRASGDPRLSAQTAADGIWWKALKDPALDRLIELAYRQNLSLQITGLRIVEARAQFAVATGRQFPQTQALFGSAEAVGLTEQVSRYTGLNRNLLAYQVGFDAAWELDFWGKYRRGVESEAAALLASVADYDAALVSLTAEVARTYVAMRTAEVLIQLAEDNARVQEEALGIAKARFQAGATSELDPTQAATLLESTRASVPRLRIGLEQARNALSRLLGQPPGAVEALLAGPKEIPKPPEKVGVGVPGDILRRRPDIRSAELAAAAQCARIGIAKAELYPSFSIVGTIGLRALNSGSASHNLFSKSSVFYSVGPSINWPFLNYGRLKNNVRVEDARFQQSLVGYRDAVLKAAQEVEDALAGFVNAQQAVVFEQNAVTSAQRSVQLAIVQYREGASDYQRVLDAQRSLLQEQNSLADSSSGVITNLIALYKALGGGWELRQGQPIVPAETQQEMEARTGWGDMLTTPRGPEKASAPATQAPNEK
jgi:NodT family efflux transporter outer membrane factor (OMF) lipoprotein